MSLEQITITTTLPTLMCGDVRTFTDAGFPVALAVDPQHLTSFHTEVPLEKWRLASEVRNHQGDNVTVLIPDGRDVSRTVARLHRYRPVPKLDLSGMRPVNWEDVEPSPNPGLLAYHVNDSLTVITLPMMVKKRTRHNWYRHFFLQVSDAPTSLGALSAHNNPGISIKDERELVERLRRAVCPGPRVTPDRTSLVETSPLGGNHSQPPGDIDTG